MMKVVVSHIGLTTIVVLYAVAGGFIFQHLEETNEQADCQRRRDRFDAVVNETKHEIWAASIAFVNQYNAVSGGGDDNTRVAALEEYARYLVALRNDSLALGYDGTDCARMGQRDGPGFRWSLPGSLLFAVTVITTIGTFSLTAPEPDSGTTRKP